MTYQNGNTSNRIVWYIIGALTALVISLVGAWAGTIAANVKENTERISEMDRRYLQEVTKINAKLDSLIEQRVREERSNR